MRGSESSQRRRSPAGRRAATLVSGIVLSLVTACGGGGSSADPAEAPRPAGSLVEVMRELGNGMDYDTHESPAALGGAASVTVVGRVEDVAEGRVFGVGPTRNDEPVRLNLTMTVRVDKVLAGNASLVRNGRVYVEVHRTKAYPVSTFKKLTPANQRLILFLDDYTAGPGTWPLIEKAPTIPDGAPVLAPYADGFLIEDGASGPVVGGYDPLDDQPAAWRSATAGVTQFVGKHFPRS